MSNLTTNVAVNQIAQALTNVNPNFNTNAALNLVAQVIAEAGDAPLVLQNVTLAEKNTLTPEYGMLVYQTDGIAGVYYYDVTNAWIFIGNTPVATKRKVALNVLANGSFTNANASTDTLIAVGGVPTFNTNSADFTYPTGGRIQYVGVSPITVIVRADTSVQKVSAPNRFGRIGVNRNSVISGASLFNNVGGKSALPFNTLGTNVLFTHQFQVVLNTNDYLELYMNKSAGGLETFAFQTISITIEEV